MQAFPIRRAAGTYDMQEFWNPDIRGIAPSVAGWYRVSWNFTVEQADAATNHQFSVQILPQYTTNAFGATTTYYGNGTNYLHSGVHTVRVEDLAEEGVIHPAVDGFSEPFKVRAAQMLVEYVSGL
ncbi:hypothetical protein [Streptomyces triticagri]|nr:hypothetical protein [Streptomyces triticagri]